MKEQQVNEIPDCDFCLVEGRNVKAKYFGHTSGQAPSRGREANMCEEHLKEYGQVHRVRLLTKSAIFFSILFMAYTGVCFAQPAIVMIAESQIGKGEQGGDNRGPIVMQYTRGQEVAWCAGFVSWVRFHAGFKGDYFLAARSYLKFPHVSRPRAGDLIILRRAGGNHVGIVEDVRGSTVRTIEGNVGPYPARVKRVTYTLGSIPNLLAFVRI